MLQPMPIAFHRWRAALALWLCLIFGAAVAGGQTASTNLTVAALSVITNSLEIRQLGLQDSGVSRSIRLEGQVCWVSSTNKAFAIVDAFGGVVLQIEGQDQLLSVGQLVRLTGNASILKTGNVFRVGVDGLVINDDGLHPLTERTGSAFFKAGRIPIHVEWFNGNGPFGLEVTYEGPGLTQRKIADSELYRTSGDGKTLVNGLDYVCYEGWWAGLPDFAGLDPVKSGTANNFDLNVRTRDLGVGLRFAGFFDVPRDGEYTFHLKSDDGGRLAIGRVNVRVDVVGDNPLPAPRVLSIGELVDESEDGSWSRIEGKVTQVRRTEDGLRIELGVGLARVEVDVTDKSTWSESELLNQVVEVSGFCQAAYNADGLKIPSRLLVANSRLLKKLAPSTHAQDGGTNRSGLHLLTTAAEVHRLKRKEAQLQYPVRVRGVVTSIDPGPSAGFTLQDSTGGVYVQDVSRWRVRDFVEVEGVTDAGEFAPMLRPTGSTRLGDGLLPEPIHPAWDQLMNGSLDAQYVEIEGIATLVSGSGLQLMTHGGTISVQLFNGFNPEETVRYKNTLVRIRGTLLAVWNAQTHQVKLGEIRIFNPEIILENSGMSDILSAPYKTRAELSLYDPQASLFQRIRVSGQIVYIGGDTGFMMADSGGVRFLANTTTNLRVGDMVDAAGYPQLSAAAPLLREAVVQKTGYGPLPEAKKLAFDDLGDAAHDSTLVSIEAVLTGVRTTGLGSVMEMQEGAQSFVARLNGPSDLPQSLLTGSRLRVTGVYAVQGGNQISGQHTTSFELLLDSPAGIEVLARPPWWTLRRMLIMVGVLLCLVLVGMVWIRELHRKVEERTSQLEEQIQKRERIEQHRAMEQERARVARDLHDELGSSLTEISMLAAVPSNGTDSTRPLDHIGDRARQMVAALDEIVWAMNPKHDLLESLGSYLCLYADRFLKLANITCRLKGTLDLPALPLNPIHRHEFFLAFKEALTNVVRHSGASEVRLSIRTIGDRLRVCVADNGGGLGSEHSTAEMDGLANMRVRLERIGGRFSVASGKGRGTIVRFYLSLE